MILVTGAGGKTGQSVVQALARRGADVRALVRVPDQIDDLQTAGAMDVQVGNLRNRDHLLAACRGVTTIYHICPNLRPDEISIAQLLMRAARGSACRRLVYHSVLHPQIEEMPHHWQKLRVEELLFKSGLDYTILQPAAYMQNVLAYWPAMMERGLYRVPYAVSTQIGMVDLEDVAAVAAMVLTEEGHDGATYELCGPGLLDQAEIAATVAAITGRAVTAEAMPPAEWADSARHSALSDYAIETLLQMFDYYEQVGFYGNPRVLESLLGRPATTFAAFVARQHAAWNG